MDPHEKQPGEHLPTDGVRPEDRSRLHQNAADDRGGTHAPKDGEQPGDHARQDADKRKHGNGVHFSAPFIQRPVATLLLSAAIIIAGSVGYKMLPVASLPEVEFPVISVGASLPGADPETMASAVATPLERQFSRIAGINQMTSSSSTGAATITMQFDLNRDINGAARDVQAAINAARSQLPANLPQNPTYRKINPADAPIMILTLTSDTMSVPQLYDASDSILAQRIATVPGVGQVFTGGSAKPAVRIEANPTQLTNNGLGLEALRGAIGTINVNQPKGYLNDSNQRWAIYTTDQLFGADAYRPLIVSTSAGPVSSAAATSGLQSNVSSATGNGSTYTATYSGVGQNVAGGASVSSSVITGTAAPSAIQQTTLVATSGFTPQPTSPASTAGTGANLGSSSTTGVSSGSNTTTSSTAGTSLTTSTTAATPVTAGPPTPTTIASAGSSSITSVSAAPTAASGTQGNTNNAANNGSNTTSTSTTANGLTGGGGGGGTTVGSATQATGSSITGGTSVNGTSSTTAGGTFNIPTVTSNANNTSSNIPLASASNYASNALAPTPSAPGVVRIGDVANVIDSVEDIHTGGTLNGKPAILVVVFKAPGANVIDTVDRIEAMLPTLRASISPAINLQVTLDRTTTIRASVKDITRTLIITVLLVIMVVFFFLREARSTLIPSVSVPLSLLGTFGVMYLLGYTLDNLSLMALTISTGFVVDDAIVVIENISRHLEKGMTPYEAAMKGSSEIGFTVVSMSISLIAVFIPILMMGGIVGRLFREFAVTLSVAILVSLVVSLTTTPMLSAKFLEPHNKRKHGRFYKWSESFFDWMLAEYEIGLNWVLEHQLPVLLVTIGTAALSIYLFIIVPKGFFPQQDTGRLQGVIQGQQDVSFQEMQAKAQLSTKAIEGDPAIESTMTFMGGGGPGGGSSNQGRMFIMLKPLEDRPGHVSADDVINRLRPRLLNTPGLNTYLQVSQELNIGGRASSTQYQYTLQTDNFSDLGIWTPRMVQALSKLPELRDVVSDLQDQGLQTELVIDRDTASRLGVSPLDIDNTLSDAFGQRQVSVTYKQLNQYHVVMEAGPEFQTSPDSIKTIFIKNSAGAQIPLSAISHFENIRVPLSLAHQGLSPAATVSFNLAPNVALSQASEAIEQARTQIGVPATILGTFQGTAAAFQQSLATEKYLIILALVAVYIVLGMLYESFIHPFTILSTIPSAGVGAILALLLTQTDLSVIAIIGVILLIGIVKKNAIMMIDFALAAERNEGKSPVEAIHEACLLRFRPIMMTTMAALLGALPLALGTGTGSELRRPLGITIVGGLIVSQCLTLFTTPVVYLYFERIAGSNRKAHATRAQAVPNAQPLPAPGD